MGALLRLAYFQGGEVVVPEANKMQWDDLARALSNLNQLARHLNAGDLPEDVRPLLSEMIQQVHALRSDLLGRPAKPTKKGAA
ncbi:MAG: hypothetical protein ACLQVY_13950 [Limisphaerales bacterium]